MAESNERDIEERKQRVKKWLKDPYNLALIGILIVAFVIRLYYLFVTSGQPLWWDEAEYMSTAKHWAFGVPYDLNPQRPPLFQLIGTLLLLCGFSETLSKFVLVLIPSTFLIFAIYLLGNEMFGKKVGLISAFASSALWTYLFWTARFQPDFFSMSFQVLSLLFFWKLLKTDKTSYAVFAGIFAALGFYFKISALLVPLSMMVYALIKDNFKVFKDKKYWILLGSFIAAMVPFMIWQYLVFGNPVAFAPSYAGSGLREGWQLGWMTFNFFYNFPMWSFFILLLIGLCIALFKIVFSFDLIIKEKERRLDGELFSITVLLLVSSFYIFYIKGTIEDRWVFLIGPFIFYFSALGLLFVYERVKKYTRIIAVILVIALFIWFFYSQLTFTSLLVDNKKTSYQPIKDAALWIRDNSDSLDIIFSVSWTQTIYYSEKQTYTYSHLSEKNFTMFLLEHRPKYIMASILEPNHPDWLIRYERYQSGAGGIIMPYFNSSIIFMPQKQPYIDIKPIIDKANFSFTLVYPTKNIEGVFVYKIDYKGGFKI